MRSDAAGAQAGSAPWLDAQQERYYEAPERAGELWNELLPTFLALPEAPPKHWPVVAFALLLCQLGYERRQLPPLEPVLARALAWCEAGREPELLPRLLCVSARLQVVAQEFERAAELLQRAGSLLAAQTVPDPLSQGLLLGALGQLTLLQGEPERALGYARQALPLYRAMGYRGPWVQVYAAQAIALRSLGRQAERRAVLLEGITESCAQRRWSEAANLATGLIDMALEQGDLPAAWAALEQGEALAAQADQDPATPCHRILRFSRARCLAQAGQAEAACALVEPVLDDALRFGGPTELLRRLDDLADWQAQSGRGAAALTHSRRAHAMRLHMAREAQERSGLALRQQVELEHTERERQWHRQRADEAARQSAALQEALDQLQALQEELARYSRAASLGPLLAGVAHELNTPLGTALTALSHAGMLAQELMAWIEAERLQRPRLLARLGELAEAQALARRGLERALALTASYRPARHDGAAGAPLAALVERAWARALSPTSCLRLQLQDGVGAPLWPSQALEEVLVQLFQNVERHAYAPGEPGLVRVQAAAQPTAHALLAVEDLGCGIAPDLLPHVFEPYVSTQFGRGRSGLGLFIAEAAVRQQLGGRLRVHSRPGQGTRFEIECPLGAAAAD
ncbi:sensor histidine kinase [Inhella sp.]|uniref:sensor histidine kinase n=1 Tax=Inhella sp. TaxID=1921806 RepID=UPI0035B2DEF3